MPSLREGHRLEQALGSANSTRKVGCIVTKHHRRQMKQEINPFKCQLQPRGCPEVAAHDFNAFGPSQRLGQSCRPDESTNLMSMRKKRFDDCPAKKTVRPSDKHPQDADSVSSFIRRLTDSMCRRLTGTSLPV